MDHARAWVLALRVLLRWSEPSDGCASLVGQHMSALDSALMRSRSVAFRAEGFELLREVSEHVASVRILLEKRHVLARDLFRCLVRSTDHGSRQGPLHLESRWEPSDQYQEYYRDCVKLESGEAGAEIRQAVAWADYAICAYDLHWTGVSALPRPDEEPLGWINVRFSGVGGFSVSGGWFPLCCPLVSLPSLCAFFRVCSTGTCGAVAGLPSGG